jgi:ERCC4-type nuclease
MPTAKRPLILQDDREKSPWVFGPEVDVQVAHLATADYSVGGFAEHVCVERKSKQDLVLSVASGERERFFDSCRRMMDYKYRVIVVECYPDDIWGQTYRSQASPLSVMASTWAILTDYQVPTVFAGNAKEAARQVQWMLCRWHKRLTVQKERGEL